MDSRGTDRERDRDRQAGRDGEGAEGDRDTGTRRRGPCWTSHLQREGEMQCGGQENWQRPHRHVLGEEGQLPARGDRRWREPSPGGAQGWELPPRVSGPPPLQMPASRVARTHDDVSAKTRAFPAPPAASQATKQRAGLHLTAEWRNLWLCGRGADGARTYVLPWS